MPLPGISRFDGRIGGMVRPAGREAVHQHSWGEVGENAECRLIRSACERTHRAGTLLRLGSTDGPVGSGRLDRRPGRSTVRTSEDGSLRTRDDFVWVQTER